MKLIHPRVLFRLSLAALVILGSRYAFNLSRLPGSYTLTYPPVDSFCASHYVYLKLSSDGSGIVDAEDLGGKRILVPIRWASSGSSVYMDVPRNDLGREHWVTMPGRHQMKWSPGVVEAFGLEADGVLKKYGVNQPHTSKFIRNFF